MKYKKSLLSALFLATFLAPFAANAQVITLAGDDPAHVDLGVGGWNFIRTSPVDPPSGIVGRLQYQFGWQLFYLHPILGVEGVDRAGETNAYGYGGLAADVFLLDRHLVLTPYAAAGGWTRGGVDYNLGSQFEILVGAKLAYQFSNNVRVGISVDHISNGGTAKINRGVEDLMAVVSIPLPGFFP